DAAGGNSSVIPKLYGLAGQLDEQRDADHLLVKRMSMLEGTVLRELPSVVRGEHDQRLIIDSQSPQLSADPPHVVIDEAHLALVELSRPQSLRRRNHDRTHADLRRPAEPVTHSRGGTPPGSVSRRRLIGTVRVEVVKPQKKVVTGMLAEPVTGESGAL